MNQHALAHTAMHSPAQHQPATHRLVNGRMGNILFALTLAISAAGCSTTPSRSGDNLSGYSETGKASYYADRHHLKKTASGELYNHNLKTAAHKTLPFGSRIKVTNVNNGKSVVVKVNDRGPFVRGRIVDLSKSAFSSIGSLSAGILSVKLEVVE